MMPKSDSPVGNCYTKLYKDVIMTSILSNQTDFEEFLFKKLCFKDLPTNRYM